LRQKRQQHQPGIYLRPPNPEFSDHLNHELTFVSRTRGESSAHLLFEWPEDPHKEDNSDTVLLFLPAEIIIELKTWNQNLRLALRAASFLTFSITTTACAPVGDC
jgi:hypothetical protein